MQEQNVTPQILPQDPATLERNKDYERKRKVFRIVVKIVQVLLALLILYLFGNWVKETYFKKEPLPPLSNTNAIIPNGISPIQDVPQGKKLYKSDDLKISFLYPENVLFSENIDPAQQKSAKVVILYSEDPLPEGEVLTQDKIRNGFIFRISRFSTFTKKDTWTLAGIKQRTLESYCDNDSSAISRVEGIALDGIAGNYFTAVNCVSDFRYTYIPRFYSYYEIEEIYRGDIGYRQRFKAASTEILETIRFYPEEFVERPKPPEAYIEYVSEYLNFGFMHPRYDIMEYPTPEPPSGGYRSSIYKIDTIVDSENSTDESNFQGFGIYFLGTKKQSFWDAVESQKQLLKDEYMVDKGELPSTNERVFKAGSHDAIWLKGYTWRGNDLIYIENSQSGGVIVLSIVNKTGDEFEKALEDLLASFRFDVRN